MPKTKDQSAHSHLRSGRWISEKKRFAIYLRDGMQCVYCQRSVESALGTAGCALDHVVADGGNTEGNLVTCCKECNDSKGGSSHESFCDKLTIHRIESAIAKRIDENAGAARHAKWKEERDGTILPVLPLLNFRQMHALLGITHEEFEKLSGALAIKKLAGGFDIAATVRAVVGGAQGGGSMGRAAAAKLALAESKAAISIMAESKMEGTLCLQSDYNNNYADAIAQGVSRISRLPSLTKAQKEDVFREMRAIKLPDLAALSNDEEKEDEPDEEE